MSYKCAVFPNSCLIHIEYSNTLCFFGVCCSQLNVVALIPLCLLSLQDIIVVKGLRLSGFKLRCEIGLHKRPETLFIHIKRLKNKFLKWSSCLMCDLPWSCMLLIVIQLLCNVLLNRFAIWRGC